MSKSAVTAITKNILVMYCMTCAAVRYRSNRELGTGEEIRPNDFSPVGDAPPPPPAGPPLCHECQSLMKLMPEETAQVMLGHGPALTAQTRQQLAKQAADYQEPLTPDEFFKNLTFTLFEVKPGEEIKEIQDSGPALMIITNRRIVALRKA